MPALIKFPFRWTIGLALALCLGAAGCETPDVRKDPNANPVPRELRKSSLPPYVVEPPDILVIDTLRAVPKPPYRIQPLDTLIVQAANVSPAEPITGTYGVEPEGTLNFGPTYGLVRVTGLTLEEARQAILAHLKDQGFMTAEVRVSISQSRAMQQVRGDHLVRPDGTVSLGYYGSVHVAGLTLEEIKTTIESYLSQFLLQPEVSVDVFAYNSKVYYIITDGGGFGEGVYRFPSTGNETVLDAMSLINGLPVVASKHHIWVARPDPDEKGCCRKMPVDWKAITRCADTRTNYQLLPGDRIYVQAQRLITIDTALTRFIAPIERVLGVTLLGSSVVHEVAIPLGSTSNGNGL
jgi:polysaccharide export outer membrane protein